MLKKKSISVAILFVTVLLASSGCEKRADVVNVQEYSQDGIFFSLPGNWDVSEDVPESEETFRYIIVETPGDALFMLFKYPKEDSSGLDVTAGDKLTQ